MPAPGRHGLVYVDTVIVAHSNEAEWQKFKADHTNEAILDRIVVIRVPYNLRLSEEVRSIRRLSVIRTFAPMSAPHTQESPRCSPSCPGLDPTNKCDLMRPN